MPDLDVKLERVGGVARLRIDRPAARNALSVEMMKALNEAVEEVGADADMRCLLITGSGRAFCAGMDLSDDAVTPGQGDAGWVLEAYLNPLLERLADLPCPVVTAVNGAAAGAGCSLALAGDIVVTGRSAFFLQAFINVGLVPDMGATWLLPRLAGRARAMAMMMLGERIGAEQALEWGMIYQVVEDAELETAAVTLAERLAQGPTRAYRLLRRGVRACLDGPLATALALEREHQREAGLSRDYVEGVAAFTQKRPAVFTGR